jgi:hypothetical protein
MTLSNTYQGKSAGGWLKSAHIARSVAGSDELWLDGGRYQCDMGERSDFTGCAVQDVLVILDADGVVARLHTSKRAYTKLTRLIRAAYGQE